MEARGGGPGCAGSTELHASAAVGFWQVNSSHCASNQRERPKANVPPRWRHTRLRRFSQPRQYATRHSRVEIDLRLKVLSPRRTLVSMRQKDLLFAVSIL